MPYKVYIIQSIFDGSYYIGYTKNLETRLFQHNNAKTGYSSKKAPWIIVYFETFEIKSAAIKRERFLKNQKSRDFIKKLIAEQF
jgi:putative endonuclease